MLFVKFSIYNYWIVYRKDCYNTIYKVFYIVQQLYIEKFIELFFVKFFYL